MEIINGELYKIKTGEVIKVIETNCKELSNMVTVEPYCKVKLIINPIGKDSLYSNLASRNNGITFCWSYNIIEIY